MIVLSLFDGVSCGKYVLNKLGVKGYQYVASEINPYAEKVSVSNHPDITRVGDVTAWRGWNINWQSVGLVIAGSPCQGFSSAGTQGGTKAIVDGNTIVIDTREKYLWAKSVNAEFLSQSHLFWEFILILDHVKSVNPAVLFMLENVKMSANNMDMITRAIGVEPVFINSALVSAQNRQRYYWCNWWVPQPADRGILLVDILEQSVPDEWDHTADAVEYMNRVGSTGRVKWSYALHSDTDKGKSACVVSNFHKGVPGNVLIDRVDSKTRYRAAAAVGRKINNDGKRDDYNSEIKRVQLLEVQEHSKSRCLSTVQKDTLYSDLPPGRYVEKEVKTRYRKFTPVECERLQGLPDNYTAGVDSVLYYPYKSEVINQQQGVDICNVKLQVVKDNLKQENMVNCVYFIIKDSLGEEPLNYQYLKTTKKKNVSIVIEKLERKVVEQEGCVINITRTGLDTGTLYTQIKYVLNSVLEGTKKEFLVRTYTGKLLKITLEENCLTMRLFIILIVINLITKLEICTFAMGKVNIQFCIDSLKKLQENSYNVVLSSLKMVTIKPTVSNTQRYIAIGNGWQCDTIEHIFFWMLIHKLFL